MGSKPQQSCIARSPVIVGAGGRDIEALGVSQLLQQGRRLGLARLRQEAGQQVGCAVSFSARIESKLQAPAQRQGEWQSGSCKQPLQCQQSAHAQRQQPAATCGDLVRPMCSSSRGLRSGCRLARWLVTALRIRGGDTWGQRLHRQPTEATGRCARGAPSRHGPTLAASGGCNTG